MKTFFAVRFHGQSHALPAIKVCRHLMLCGAKQDLPLSLAKFASLTQQCWADRASQAGRHQLN